MDEPASADDPRTSGESERTEQVADFLETVVNGVELAAAAIFVLLFAIGVFDLALSIGEATLSGEITDPDAVIDIIDTGLLLLIIVEVYQTVIAYTRQSDTHRIVRLIIYTGIIAMVRKVIIFHVHDFATMVDALLAALAYTIIIVALGVALWIEQQVSPVEAIATEE